MLDDQTTLNSDFSSFTFNRWAEFYEVRNARLNQSGRGYHDDHTSSRTDSTRKRDGRELMDSFKKKFNF